MNHALHGLCAHLIIAAIGTIGPAPSLSADEKIKPAPRYRVKAGQELTYHSSSTLAYRASFELRTRDDETKWQAYVVRKNRDGSWHVVLCWTYQWWVTDDQGKRYSKPGRNSLVVFDLFADGRLAHADSTENGPDPADLFPRLPGDPQDALNGWVNVSKEDGRRSRFTPTRDEKKADDVWAFDEVRERPLDPFFLMQWRCRFFFDSRQGLVVRARTETNQDGGARGKQTGITELKSVKERDAAWLTKLGEEADRFCAAEKAYRKLTERAFSERNAALLTDAESTLKKALDKLTVPFLREQMGDRLKTHGNLQKGLEEDERNHLKVIGKPATGWEKKDLAGQTHSLASYRGKVVVLDFWYRRCAFCIKAMPQVAQIARDFTGEPVVVLGMNTDTVEKDAQFVVDKLKIRYPVLKADGRLRASYGASGYPALIIIDQSGKVRAVHEGWSPTLRDDVGKEIRRLLAKR